MGKQWSRNRVEQRELTANTNGHVFFSDPCYHRLTIITFKITFTTKVEVWTYNQSCGDKAGKSETLREEI